MVHCKLFFTLPFVVISFLVLISWKGHGYAEIHYTFFRYSLISRGYPEILADTPWRVDPGQPIPVVCIVKDADRFPVELRRITVRCRMQGGETQEKCLLDTPLYISDHYWNMLYFTELFGRSKGSAFPGNVEITVEIEFMRNGIKKTVISDNLPGLSHAPFRVFAGSHRLPAFDGWYCGDPHYHSDMTQDQIEFGAPVEVAVAMAKAIGLSWLAVTDHSYDLDRAIGEYFEHDSKLARWMKVRKDAELVNSRDSFFVIPAEEISCGNCKSHNVHLLAFDTPHFIPGSGDGVKRGLNKRPDLTLRQCINRINSVGGFAYAAHPEEGNGFLGTLLLNRDHWRDSDYAQGGYSGLQLWNGVPGKEFNRSYEKWIQLLLEGRKLYILGGNDAHGDFNRCRKVKYPNTRLSESYDNIFGKVRTYAYCETHLSAKGILDAMRNGRTVVTNGPLAILQARNDKGQIANIGDDIAGREFTLMINSCSSDEFGSIDRIDLYQGDFTNGQEQLERTFVPQKGENTHFFTYRITHRNRGYVRLEATSSARGNQYRCLTNPIWLSGLIA